MDILKFFYKITNKKRTIIFKNKIKNNCPTLIGMIRVRNEELILNDTLQHMSSFCDYIIAYDDASTDRTNDILQKHPNVIAVIRNYNWLPGIEDRLRCETEDRFSLLELAKSFNPKWLMYLDADERIVGNVKGFVQAPDSNKIDAVRISLFDAYMTKDDHLPYTEGTLLGFRKYFGIERRDIIMLWRNCEDITYQGLDSREPIVPKKKKIITRFYCQHYGKSLSIEHWEQTCEYYIQHFPFIPYGEKWSKRIGKSIHEKSDFDTPLYMWGQELFDESVKIHPIDKL